MTLARAVRVSVWYLATLLGLFFVMAQRTHLGAGPRRTPPLVTHRRLLLAVACAAVPSPRRGAPARDARAVSARLRGVLVAGIAWNAGGDPYGRAIWNAERNVPGVDASRDELLPFVGPPPDAARVERLRAAAVRAAAALWPALLAIALLALAAVGAPRSRKRAALALLVAAALALAVAFGPVTSDLALGQLALPAFSAAPPSSLVAARSISAATAAACLAFAQPNAALGLLSQLGRNRATFAIVASAILTYALGALAAGRAWPPVYARALAAHAGAERWNAIQLAPAAIAYGFGATQWWATVAGAAVAMTR